MKYWNRLHQRWEEEKVYGDKALKWLYQTFWGRVLGLSWLRQPWVSRFYGWTQSTAWSARKIPAFVKKFQILEEEFEPRSYASFNDFFIRTFKPGKRPFESNPRRLPAPAEARYFAWSRVDGEAPLLPVKKLQISVKELVGRFEWVRLFEGGPVLLARLCPVDYHRFHFPESGISQGCERVQGGYDSVNPLAFSVNPRLLMQNERQVTVLQTEAWGAIGLVEVGALCVGKIVQTASLQVGARVERGQEKGYFLFGGSTVLVLGQPGRWVPDADLLEKTAQGYESWVPLGQGVATLL